MQLTAAACPLHPHASALQRSGSDQSILTLSAVFRVPDPINQ
jgi:hypothetical protein